MANIVDINECNLKHGASMFIACSKREGVEFAAIVVYGGDEPVISTLVCLNCNAGADVIYDKVGIFEMPEKAI